MNDWYCVEVHQGLLMFLRGSRRAAVSRKAARLQEIGSAPFDSASLRDSAVDVGGPGQAVLTQREVRSRGVTMRLYRCLLSA